MFSNVFNLILIYAEFIRKLSNEKTVEKISPNWEEDMTECEYWEKELEEWEKV